jgi:hypothetical protein
MLQSYNKMKRKLFKIPLSLTEFQTIWKVMLQIIKELKWYISTAQAPTPRTKFPVFSFQPHFRTVVQRTSTISDTRHLHQRLVNFQTNNANIRDNSMTNLSDKLSDIATPHTDQRTIILDDECSLCVVLNSKINPSPPPILQEETIMAWRWNKPYSTGVWTRQRNYRCE